MESLQDSLQPSQEWVAQQVVSVQGQMFNAQRYEENPKSYIM